MYYENEKDITVLMGEVITEIIKSNDDDVLQFNCQSGRRFIMYHCQDCCEYVHIDDIEGNLDDLLHTPILQAEDVSSQDIPAKDEYDESYTWTFYKLATIKGYVTIKWYGTSNGYYSESVEFCEL